MKQDALKKTARRYRLCVMLAALLAVATVGCSDGRPTRVPVSGTVLIDGKPLQTGNIMFVPAQGGRPSSGAIASNGRFTLRCYEENDGALTGTHNVAVSSKKIISDNNVKWYAPSHYSNHENSGITVEITEATDDLVIELSSEEPNNGKRGSRRT